MKKSTILFFCMIFVTSPAFCQTISLKGNAGKDFNYAYLTKPENYLLNSSNNTPVPPKFYVKNLGFFCKQELKFQAVTGLPLKFRLGSVAYNDWMEGKINAGIKPLY